MPRNLDGKPQKDFKTGNSMIIFHVCTDLRVLAWGSWRQATRSMASYVIVLVEHTWLSPVGPELEKQGKNWGSWQSLTSHKNSWLIAADWLLSWLLIVGQSFNCHMWSDHYRVCIFSLSWLFLFSSITLPTWLSFLACFNSHLSSLSLNPYSASSVIFYPGPQKLHWVE